MLLQQYMIFWVFKFLILVALNAIHFVDLHVFRIYSKKKFLVSSNRKYSIIILSFFSFLLGENKLV